MHYELSIFHHMPKKPPVEVQLDELKTLVSNRFLQCKIRLMSQGILADIHPMPLVYKLAKDGVQGYFLIQANIGSDRLFQVKPS